MEDDEDKTPPVDKSGGAVPDDEDIPKEDPKEVDDHEEDYSEEDEVVEEGKSKENHPRKGWKKILKMKLIQLMQRRLRKSSDFLSNPKNPPEKSAAGPNVMRSSSSIRPDIKRDKLLRKFTSPRHNLQLPFSGVSVGACSDQLQGGKLFNSEEYFQKISGQEDGGDYNQGEVNVRTFAKKSEDKFESLGRIIKKEAFVHADPSVRGNKCVIDAIFVMIPY